jgi:two-component system cell cycle response regulator
MPKARVLAVDDQRYFRELIEGLLSEEGYEVQTASSGEEAIHILERDDFDVIVTDLVMPGIDGTQLVQHVKERRPEQDIVMVTGVIDVKTAVEAMKQGATDYILKPFDGNVLARSLEKILQRRRLRHEHARLMEENLEYMGVLSLYERAAGLFSTLGVEPLGERLIEGLCLETRAQGGVLWVADDLGESRLKLMGARGLIRIDEETRSLRTEDLDSELVETGRSIVRQWDNGSGGAAETESQVLFVPLRRSGDLLGVARLSDKLEGGEFGKRDRAAAEKFAGLGAVALANALRFRSLERRSFRDPVTRAYSHAYFKDVVRNEIQKATRFGRHFSIVRVDLGALGALRERTSQNQLERWIESVLRAISQVLRSSDLLAAESESRFSVLLPETDALGAAILKQRIHEVVHSSGALEHIAPEIRPDFTLAAATHPTDGTQLEALDRTLETRIVEDRLSLLRSLSLAGRRFEHVLATLLDDGEIEQPTLPGQVTRFLIDEIKRRPRDRGLLCISPGGGLMPVIREGLEQLHSSRSRTEVVLVGDPEEESFEAGPITWVSPARTGTDLPFLLYYGEGPAYAMVSGSKCDSDGLTFFHTSDRALVEHLAFQLKRELGIPLGS